MGFNYRISIIPAGAITDARLTARALQVLCLLGRHTNDAGWCARSQVKMARELSCSRSTVQLALELLHETGWVERRANGRGGVPAEASEHPFAAYSYRVVLDRDDLPARAAAEQGEAAPVSARGADPSAPPPGGADQSAGGADQSAGGADQSAGGADPESAPLEEESLLKGRVSEPESERETRAREALAVTAFQARWPTAASDDQTHTARAWSALTAAERQEALDGIQPFVEQLKLNKRSHVPAGWRYLEERRWTLLPKRDAMAADAVVVNTWSREWWAVLLGRIERGGNFSASRVGFLVDYAVQRGIAPMSFARAEMPSPEALERLVPYPSGGPEFAAWRPWLARRGARLPQPKGDFWVYLPAPAPPDLADAAAPATGPPSAASSSGRADAARTPASSSSGFVRDEAGKQSHDASGRSATGPPLATADDFDHFAETG